MIEEKKKNLATLTCNKKENSPISSVNNIIFKSLRGLDKLQLKYYFMTVNLVKFARF